MTLVDRITSSASPHHHSNSIHRGMGVVSLVRLKAAVLASSLLLFVPSLLYLRSPSSRAGPPPGTVYEGEYSPGWAIDGPPWTGRAGLGESWFTWFRTPS